MRPILRPGTHVLRRAPGELQVGLDPSSALVLPDIPSVRDTLRRLSSAAQPVGDEEPDAGTVALLEEHGQLIDEADLLPLLGDGDRDLAPGATAALARAAGAGLSATRHARRRARTSTGCFGGPAGERLRDPFLALTGSAGIREASGRASAPPDCGVLVGVGEPDREHVDAWTRAGTPYVVVRLTEGRAVVGPFVAPGTTACLRCVDAHCTDADPAWPLLVRQYAAASARDREDGVPEPVDPLLASLALAWAAHDVTCFVDGGRPSTWSATVTLHPRLTHLETRDWLRHPACACSWA